MLTCYKWRRCAELMRQPGDRRDRLKYVQEQISQARGADAVMGGDESSSDEDDEDEVCPSFALSM